MFSEPEINNFFEAQKVKWLKGKTKPNMDESDIRELEVQCEQIFSLKQWLPNASRRAGQIKISSHPCTFSHPSANKNKNGKVSAVIAKANRDSDGFVRSGNVDVDLDALGNAAALDVYRFLTLRMSDGTTLIEHIESNSDVAKSLLNRSEIGYEATRLQFLEMLETSEQQITSSKIKQVYFPISLNNDDYHLLSVLTPSGIVYKLRERIDHIRYSDESKDARKAQRDNGYSATGFLELPNLTMIAYGGTKPQNISTLNNKFAGRAYLLPSTPPSLSDRRQRLPNSDFFTECINPYQFKENFFKLHQLFSQDYTNQTIRAAIKRSVSEFVDLTVEQMWKVRLSLAEHPYFDVSNLESNQKQWLQKTNNDSKLEKAVTDEIVKQLARCFFAGYKKVLAKEAVTMSDFELSAVIDWVSENKELLV